MPGREDFVILDYNNTDGTQFFHYVNQLRRENGKGVVPESVYGQFNPSAVVICIIPEQSEQPQQEQADDLGDYIEEINEPWEEHGNNLIPVATGNIQQFSPIFSELRFFQATKNPDVTEEEKFQGTAVLFKNLLDRNGAEQVFYTCESDDPEKDRLKRVFKTEVSEQDSTVRSGIKLNLLHTTRTKGRINANALFDEAFRDGAAAGPAPLRTQARANNDDFEPDFNDAGSPSALSGMTAARRR